MRFRHEGPASLIDRFFGAVLGLVFVASTVKNSPGSQGVIRRVRIAHAQSVVNGAHCAPYGQAAYGKILF